MLGLIKKDLFLILNNLKSFGYIILIYIILAFTGTFDMSFIFPFLAVMLFISTFSYDDYNNWNSYAVTLPTGRKTIVKSKYLACIIMTIIASLIGLLISFIVYRVKGSGGFLESLVTLSGTIVSVIIIMTVMFPLMFKYGSEKGRLVLFAFVFGCAMLIGLVSNWLNKIDITSIINLINNYWFVILPLVMIVIILISYFISVRIYLKKEF